VENLLADQSRLRETANALRALLPSFQGKRPDIEAAEAIIAFVAGRSPLDNK
jgi:hypothetical protein